MKYNSKMLALTALYGVVGILTHLVMGSHAAFPLQVLWLCAIGLGMLAFIWERRTGLSLREKGLPYVLVITFGAWVNLLQQYTIHQHTWTALLRAVFATVCYASIRRDSFVWNNR